MNLTRMRHYVTIDTHNFYHVQNMLGIHTGQHHVHTETDFNQWAQAIDSQDIKHLKQCDSCPCGLKPGETK